ncbi:hypothetical protein Hanom_Chr16g01507701 [Helianthus anomalus]
MISNHQYKNTPATSTRSTTVIISGLEKVLSPFKPKIHSRLLVSRHNLAIQTHRDLTDG